MPEDTLVFGIDTGISALPVSSSTTLNDARRVGLLNGFARHNRLHQISGSQMVDTVWRGKHNPVWING